jgi:hypothetical protein
MCMNEGKRKYVTQFLWLNILGGGHLEDAWMGTLCIAMKRGNFS